MSLKDIAFLAKWARDNKAVLEVVATNLHRPAIEIAGILHHLEKSALKQIEEEEKSNTNNVKFVNCSSKNTNARKTNN